MTMLINMSKEQLNAISNLKEDAKAMLGGGDAEVDKIWSEHVAHIDAMLEQPPVPKICKNCEYWYKGGHNNYYCHLYNQYRFYHQTCDEFVGKGEQDEV